MGGSRNASLRLDQLRRNGTLCLWNSGQVIKELVTARRIEAELNLTSGPDTALGLRPNWITRFRYTGVRWVGLLGALALCVSSCVPSAYLAASRVLALVGLCFSLVYFLCVLFAKHVDRLLLFLQLEVNPEERLRWARREAGRLLAAYVHGVPVASVAQPLAGFYEISVYSRHAADFCILELSQGLSRERFKQVSLSDKETHVQAVIQMTGLVAEWLHFGAASEGFRYVSVLERHLILSEQILSPVDRQALARWGVLNGFRLLKQYSLGYDAMVKQLLKVTPGRRCPQKTPLWAGSLFAFTPALASAPRPSGLSCDQQLTSEEKCVKKKISPPTRLPSTPPPLRPLGD